MHIKIFIIFLAAILIVGTNVFASIGDEYESTCATVSSSKCQQCCQQFRMDYSRLNLIPGTSCRCVRRQIKINNDDE